MIKICAECGAEFYAPPSSKKITCSPECSKTRRSRTRKGYHISTNARKKISEKAKAKGFTDNLQKGTLASKNSEKAGRTEKNSSAKTFVIVSPNGKTYNVTNLSNWIRSNIKLFNCELTDENVIRIAHGFYTIKRNIKTNNRGQTYKGWTIFDWDDRKNFEKQNN